MTLESEVFHMILTGAWLGAGGQRRWVGGEEKEEEEEEEGGETTVSDVINKL